MELSGIELTPPLNAIDVNDTLSEKFAPCEGANSLLLASEGINFSWKSTITGFLCCRSELQLRIYGWMNKDFMSYQQYFSHIYCRTSVARTLMARLPRLFRTRS